MYETIPKLETFTAKDLLTQPIEPLNFTVDTILPCGLFLLGGLPKVGKSLLLLDMSNAIANGTPFWKYPTTQGDVLYLALEDNKTRLQKRLSTISPNSDSDSPCAVHMTTKSSRLGSGLPQQVGEFLDAYPKTKLIIIDTLQYVRKGGKYVGTYTGDYNDMDSLREIIYGRDITMILVTHSYSEEGDPVSNVYGSAGLTGAVDGIFVLQKEKRTGDKARLIITNRDTESYQIDLMFDRETCRWQFIGEYSADEPDDDDELPVLIELLLDGKQKWRGTPTQLCEAFKEIDSSFRIAPNVLSKMLKPLRGFLLEKHHIKCVFTRNKTDRIIELTRSNDDDNFEEPPQENSRPSSPANALAAHINL